MTKSLLFISFLFPLIVFAQFGFNMTELGYEFAYTIGENGQKSNAQVAVDEIYKLGGRHIVLNVRAHMRGPRSADIRLVAPDAKKEIQGITDLISYIHSLGITVGLRPIVLVLGPKGQFPYYEGNHIWWHGNINPTDRVAWFDAFEKFILFYADGLKNSNINEFTIGAEMQSMMVGMGSSDSAYLMGQPERWLNLLRKVKALNPKAKVTYDINFPETLVPLTGKVGGEFERWRHILVDLADTRSTQLKQKREALVQIWNEMDFVGLDFYRYLAQSTKNIPGVFDLLSEKLTNSAMSHATQIDNALSEISLTLGVDKKLVIKEVGYRSVNYCFINPASYSSDGGVLNIMHQAASYKALANAFIKPNWPWFGGIYLWDISTSPQLKGPTDKGFSPIGKPLTEDIIRNDYLN